MFKIAPLIAVVGLTVVLTGCTTTQKGDKNGGPPGDWSMTAEAAVIVKPPVSTAQSTNALPAVISVPTTTTWIPLTKWSAQHGLPAPVRMGVLPSASFSLSSSNGLFVFQTATRVARMNGFEFWLGFAPRMMDGEFCLHALDYAKSIEPLLGGICPAMPKTNRVIVIDPGHGGGNTGTQSTLDGRYEKEFTLDWALRLAPLLAQKGWQVFLTRTNDAEIPLGERVAFAEDCDADLFVSLHFNAVTAGNHQAGIETYCLTPVGMVSSLTREFEDDPEASFPNNRFDDLNLRYAACLHRAMLSISGTVDRGVRRARFMGVLRGQNRPAVLLEAGYLSNPVEARRIADPAYRQQLADAVAKALSQ